MINKNPKAVGDSKAFPVCEFSIEGKPDGPTLVFIHGWPDNASLWRRQVEAMGKHFRCILVTLPNFGEKPVKAGGFDFPELLGRLAATIREIQPEGTVGLVTHDWGSYAGYLLEKAHPELFVKMAALDIGGHLVPADARSALMIIGYQWALIASWLVGGLIPPLGATMTRGVAKVIRVPARQRGNIRSRYNYPYFYFWRNTLLPWKRASLLNRYRPQLPRAVPVRRTQTGHVSFTQMAGDRRRQRWIRRGHCRRRALADGDTR